MEVLGSLLSLFIFVIIVLSGISHLIFGIVSIILGLMEVLGSLLSLFIFVIIVLSGISHTLLEVICLLLQNVGVFLLIGCSLLEGFQSLLFNVWSLEVAVVWVVPVSLLLGSLL